MNTALHITPADGSPKLENITINVNLTLTGRQISMERPTELDVVKGKTCSNIAAEKERDEKAKSSSAATVKQPSTEKSEDKLDTKDRKDKHGGKNVFISDKVRTEGTSGNEAKGKTDGKEITKQTAGKEATEQTPTNDGKKDTPKTDGKSTDILGKSPKQKRKRSDSCNSSCSSDCSACNRTGSSSSSSTGSSSPPGKKVKVTVHDESDEFSSDPQEDDMVSDEEDTGSKRKN